MSVERSFVSEGTENLFVGGGGAYRGAEGLASLKLGA